MGLSNQKSLNPPVTPLSPSVPDERDDAAGAAKERGGGAGTPEATGGGAGTSKASGSGASGNISRASTSPMVAIAKYDYTAKGPAELTFKVGDLVLLHATKVRVWFE